MSVPGGFFEVTGKTKELDRIMDGIYENTGRMTSDESFTLDLWLEMKDEWFRLHDAEVAQMVRNGYTEGNNETTEV